ncbi:MAG: hypothetical protein ACE5FU_02640, partial [Nitrospinota bacterium]
YNPLSLTNHDIALFHKFVPDELPSINSLFISPIRTEVADSELQNNRKIESTDSDIDNSKTWASFMKPIAVIENVNSVQSDLLVFEQVRRGVRSKETLYVLGEKKSNLKKKLYSPGGTGVLSNVLLAEVKEALKRYEKSKKRPSKPIESITSADLFLTGSQQNT